MARGDSRSREAICPLCGAKTARHLVTKRGFEVVRCTSCALVFVWPQPTPEELAALYSSGAYHAEVDEAERRRYFARRLREIEELVPHRGRILDVGCSKGLFLEAARAHGWDAKGVELNRNAVEEARGRSLDVRCGELSEGLFPEASFDVVTLFDVIEHTREPRATLAACHKALRPGGLLVLTTPDIEGLVPSVTYWLFARTIRAWDHPTPPGHLLQFSRRSLRQALGTSGFTIIKERAEHIPLAYSVGKLENSVMDVLSGRHRLRPSAVASRRPASAAGEPCDRAENAPWRLSPRALPRHVVRLLSWAVIGSSGLAAKALGWGDSRWVAARRLEEGVGC